MPGKALRAYLESHQVSYQVMTHAVTYSASETAHQAHLTGKVLAKTVIILMDGGMAMLVLPASSRIKWNALMAELKTDFVELADESDFEDRFPDCELGAMPPFGNLYDLPVFMDASLTRQEMLTFSAGTHTELMQIPMNDYLDLVHPLVLEHGFVRCARLAPQHPSLDAEAAQSETARYQPASGE